MVVVEYRIFEAIDASGRPVVAELRETRWRVKHGGAMRQLDGKILSRERTDAGTYVELVGDGLECRLCVVDEHGGVKSHGEYTFPG